MNYSILKKGFKTYLQLERNMSENTIQAYLHDIDLLTVFLETQKNSKALEKVSLTDLKDFILFIKCGS